MNGISYSIGTIVSVESYPMELYKLFQPYKNLSYKRIQYYDKPKYEYTQIVQYISFWTIIFLFKAKYYITCYNNSHMKV